MAHHKYTQDDSPVGALKNESSRQRWELFHRAIAHAKQSNTNAMLEADANADHPKPASTMLTIVR